MFMTSRNELSGKDRYCDITTLQNIWESHIRDIYFVMMTLLSLKRSAFLQI